MVVLGLALAFLAEIGALAGVGIWAYDRAPDGARLLAALAAVAALALAWGRWAAPKSNRRLVGPALLAFKLAAYGLGVLGLALTGRPAAAALLGLAAALGLGLAWGHDAVGPRTPSR